MSPVWAVITRATKKGNMALINPELLEPIGELLGPARALEALNLQEQVFHVGEVLLLDGEYGREITYHGRKPSKWDVDYVTFPLDQPEKVIAKVREVMST
jgi:hypothetical protein